jgi:hypothetical protein
MYISTDNIIELVMSGFIEECDCIRCRSNNIFRLQINNLKTITYRIKNSDYFILFFQLSGGVWDFFYFIGYENCSSPSSTYVSFEEVFNNLPVESAEIAVYYLNFLNKKL